MQKAKIAYGVKVTEVRPINLKTLKIPLPPLEEQHAIASFLDDKIAKIQECIAKKTRMTELLKEYKQALTTQITTKGLDPQAKLKPSGVAWLGDIPGGVGVVRLRACFYEFDKECGEGDYTLLSVTQKEGIIPQSAIPNKKDISNRNKAKYKIVPLGAIAYNKMRMWQGAMGYNNISKGIVSPAYIVILPHQTAHAPYFHYLFKSPYMLAMFNKFSYGLCADMNCLRYEDFQNILTPLPPLPEQHAIASALDEKTAKIDSLLAKLQAQIQALKEHKSALISAGVLGQLPLKANHAKIQ
ncbi:hypothetical protein NHP190012_05050 [Helicobacter sp. NHP19-012]|uniref:Type I restriction modification DNA specificity domain-containing protein n=1 Tax=Helicobacter gastrofelis TaxID=2849642 RepID=A0ABN6I5Q4_9HELI|nr:restriction endonuclease subunit S [Helicobacter sp. NHP19-012]BCZ18863.1 hypothetical protein NHP190012_05050 [Helicobacter sp. NHP19-012]